MEFFFQPIHNDYAYFENKHHINIFCSENWAERIHGWFTFNSIFDIPLLHPRWLSLLLAEISNGLKKESSEIVLCHLEVKLKIRQAITCSWMSLVVHSIPVQFLTNAYHYELPLSQYRKWTFVYGKKAKWSPYSETWPWWTFAITCPSCAVD
jgi:hypothetical protein